MTTSSTATNPTGLSIAAVSTQPRSRHRSRIRLVVGILAMAGAVVGATIALTLHHGPPPAIAAESNDLPKIQGKRIVFSPAYAKQIQLESLEVGRHAVVPAFSVVGTVTFDPAHVARVGARLKGLVRNVYRFEGDRVKAGEALATVDSAELGQAQATVAMYNSENRAAQQHRTRERNLAERQLTTERYVEEANASAERSEALLAAAKQRVSALAGASSPTLGRGLGVHVLSSPLDGTIVEHHVAKGQLIDANHVAFLVADLDHVWVELSVFERALPSIKIGDRVELHADGATPGHASAIVDGEIAQIGATLDAETRGATVRVHVDNRARKFRPGQAVNATIRATAATVENVPTVPASAVIYVDGEPSVLIADSPTSVIVNAVELGETNGQSVHVKSGVQIGQNVVVRGTTALRNELFR